MNIESEIPLTGLYADEAPSGYIEPPTSAQFHAGVEPEMTLPAAWWNYFANLFTNTNIKAKLDILAILAELNNALVAAGITPDPGLNNQLVTLLQKGHGSTVNADKLDGLESGNASGQIPVSNGALNTNLIAASAAACSGNAASATKLQTARTIGGVSFNGTANINLPGVNQAGNQNTSGNAATATLAATATNALACSGNAATATLAYNSTLAAGIDFVNGSAGTDGFKTFSENEEWTIPKGTYMLIADNNTNINMRLGIKIVSNWFYGGVPNGLIVSDGVNYRIKSSQSTTIRYRKLA